MVTLSERNFVLVVVSLVFAVGFVVAVGGIAFFPLAALLAICIPAAFHLAETDREAVEGAENELDLETDPVEQLRQRYARGEIDEEEFGARLDLLLETEELTAKSNTDRNQGRRDRDLLLDG